MFIEREILGKRYHFDKTKDQLLKRGLLDIYDLSADIDEWVVLEPYIFWSQRLQSEVVIPRWMKTDLASVPKGLRWLISVNERHRTPALIHDFGYGIAGVTQVDRKVWDEVLRDFCKVYDVPSWKSSLIYRAVRLGGSAAFEDNSELLIPVHHREWYREVFNESVGIQLDVQDGRFKEL